MCFTPVASITTAGIEFLISFYLLYKINDKRLFPIVIFVFFLGFYQLTEFMLCKSVYPLFWARLWFATYTFMPILLYHFFINLSWKKIRNYFYIIPILFSFLALFFPNFIYSTSCNVLHTTVKSIIFNKNLVLMFFYLLYYSLFPILGVYEFFKKLKNKKIGFKIKLSIISVPLALLLSLIYYLWWTINWLNQNFTWLITSLLIIICILTLLLLWTLFYKKNNNLFYKINSIILSTTGIVIVFLYYLIPNIALNYSSIFCQFALLYWFASIILINSLKDLKLDS